MQSSTERLSHYYSPETCPCRRRIPGHLGVPSLSYFDSYSRVNPEKWLVEQLVALAKEVDKIYKRCIPLVMTDEQEAKFVSATVCHICEKDIEPGTVKVRDHCHITGKFRGAAHNDCNLQFKNPTYLPIFFHNLSGYDAHFIVMALSDLDGDGMDVLPINTERYISFSKKVEYTSITLRFLDSYRFMQAPLDKLVGTLDDGDMSITSAYFTDPEKFQLVKRKGVFPYEYMDSWDKLTEATLPPKSKFYSSLSESEISDEDYEHATQVWRTFQIKDLEEYASLYMGTDVRLLADLFEKFRDVCLGKYTLDPAHYFTSPGLSWQAMLRSTRVELDLLTDVDMLLLFERGIRGGICQCVHRYAKANNRYMPEYNREAPEDFIMYFDVNNLYGWAMSEYLPSGGFQWLTAKQIASIDFMNVADDSPRGFVLEVDLTIPQDKHDVLADLPPCPDHKAPVGSTLPKLMTTLEDKVRYVLHYRVLQQCVGLGLEVTKIHRVISFNQSPWLKEYISLNTRSRRDAKTDFERDFYKLMNNSIFGKTMENIRKHRDVKLCTSWAGRRGARKHIASPHFKRATIFNEDFVAVEKAKVRILFNKPVYVGMCILDLSKLRMYRFHYEFAIPQFRCPKLLYMDTDSFIYLVRNCDPYEVMLRNREEFDTSGYSTGNRFRIEPYNEKVVGVMKDEANGTLVSEFAGLRAKMYAFRLETDQTCRRAKGLAGSVTRKLTIEDYINCLHGETPRYHIQHRISSDLHVVNTVKISKLGLSRTDDKRYIFPDGVETLPWGHKSVPR